MNNLPVITKMLLILIIAVKRVLVVEDNAINLEIALEFLKLLGLTCESAGDGAKALEKFLAAPEGYYDLFLWISRCQL